MAWQSQNGAEHEGTCRGGCPRNATENLISDGNVHDIQRAEVIADKGYDSKSIVEFATKSRMSTGIPSLSNEKIPKIYDKELYKKRHIVENFFLKISVYQEYLVLPSLPLHRIHHALPQNPICRPLLDLNDELHMMMQKIS